MSPSPPSRIETLDDASGYLDGLINRERRPGFDYARLDLRPIHALLDALDRPHDELSVIHVAGSKGKGSTCLFAESILLSLGESVGTFTSPHLESWLERFRIDGRPVDEGRLVEAVRRIRPHVESLRAGPRETLPSFFDATTAIAFLLFAEARVDRAVIEVGLGGRLDSTNVVSPRVTCITSIELEHRDKLGDTEAAIAGEKAGILKHGVAAVIGSLRPEADRVIRERAARVGAPLQAFGEDFWIEPRPARRADAATSAGAAGFRYAERGGFTVDVDLAAPGEPARWNAALAIACVRALGVHSDAAVGDAARRALGRQRLPGRIERLASDPAVVIDAAHTARSAQALAAALATIAPKGFDLVLSVSSDKDLAAVLEPLLPGARRIWATRVDPIRSLPARALRDRLLELDPTRAIVCVEDPDEAIRRARAELPEEGVLCATGSVYLAGLARRLLGTKDRLAESATIERARVEDVALLPAIEARATALFEPGDLPPDLAFATIPLEVLAAAQREGLLLLARLPDGRPVGFALLVETGLDMRLEELDVDPEYTRLGLGSRLVEAARDVSRERRHRRLVLSTFRDRAWNAPFYARLGFEIVAPAELDEELAALRRREAEAGFDLERRVLMALELGAARRRDDA